MSIVSYDTPGNFQQPSPAVWGSCQTSRLTDEGLGLFLEKHFIGDDGTLPGVANSATGSGTYTYSSASNHALLITTGASDNNANAIFSRPLQKVIRTAASDHRVWFETSVALTALGDQALFAGLAELAGLADTVLANNPSNAGQAGLATESLIGFVTRQVGSSTTKLDAVLRKDAGSVVTVLEDVTNASALGPQYGANGEVFQPDLRSDLKLGTFVKLGVAYSRTTNRVDFYVNGVKVISYDVDVTVDQAKDYGGIVALKTGTAAAVSASVEFFRVAAQYL